ncbi:N-acetylmuramoyl-L-alanine amidase [Actinomadura sp. LCR2-06]|uniref:N-acetylmuramoyl-L-alanine amidase n=1 Tax=Actinomadura violacea TaxID=2819934 RepID=A0ABS3RXY8_9ACTN|nr:N-acetylmuramoyl-L-alanine amidase [Actinomadura violacea]
MTFRDQIIAGRRGTVLIAQSGDGAAGRERDGTALTRRSVIGGVVGAGLLEALAFGSPFGARALADGPSAGPDLDGVTGTVPPDPAAGRLLDERAPLFTADAPHIYTRAQWKARPPKRPAKVLDRAPDHIVVHHTDTGNSTDYSVAHAFGLSRYIQNFHMDKRGWDDSGQQLTISRGGAVMEGRNRSLASIRAGELVKGAQVLHNNDHTLGIENEGNYMRTAVPGRLWASLMEVCVWLCREYDLDPAEAIVGHRDFNQTSCPGDVLYSRLPALRRAVADRLEGSSEPKPKSKPKGKPKAPPKPKPKPRPDDGDDDPGNPTQYYQGDDDWPGLLNLNW